MTIPTDGAKDTPASADGYVRSLVEANPGPAIVIGLDGMIVDLNEAAMRLTGSPREELMGADFAATVIDAESA